ncbi:MAG: hypothetical protein PHX18_03260 [Candidatus Gastranaerophilales bacterium]|nr:hypothetical protein [Candidatus Gastranaerophilales bacterium]
MVKDFQLKEVTRKRITLDDKEVNNFTLSFNNNEATKQIELTGDSDLKVVINV